MLRPLVRESAAHGELAVSADGTAVAVWLPRGAQPPVADEEPLPERLRVFLTLTEQRHPTGREHLYLPFLGVLPDARGVGSVGPSASPTTCCTATPTRPRCPRTTRRRCSATVASGRCRSGRARPSCPASGCARRSTRSASTPRRTRPTRSARSGRAVYDLERATVAARFYLGDDMDGTPRYGPELEFAAIP